MLHMNHSDMLGNPKYYRGVVSYCFGTPRPGQQIRSIFIRVRLQPIFGKYI